jgi:hypothetical protein
VLERLSATVSATGRISASGLSPSLHRYFACCSAACRWCHENDPCCDGSDPRGAGENEGEFRTGGAPASAWLAEAVPSAISAGAATKTAPALILRIQLVLVVISILLFALTFRSVCRCVPAMYLECLSRSE